jgi:enoyl-CoA hydratase/carnithine racemase
MDIKTELSGDLFEITLNSPQNLNAQSPGMWDQLTEIYDHVPAEARFIVLRGEGKAFSAGLDRAMFTPQGIAGEPSFLDMAELADEELDARIAHYQRPFRRLRDLTQVSIALVQGYAIGAGFQLALSCDLIIVQPDAQMALKETSLGLIPDLGGAGQIFHHLGYSRALEFCATGRFMSGEEAQRVGVAIACGSDLDSELQRVIEPMRAAIPGALAETKELFRNIAYGEEPWLAERQSQTRRLRELRSLFMSATQ